ncbi:unnamed protein product [Effrenium voratum]|nr:unnamed protein product [Effrenium voratum]
MANEQGSAGNDQDMDVVHSWDGGQEGQQLDSEFRGTDCLEVEFEDDDIPDDDEGDGMAGDDDEEIGVIPENEIYSDEDTGPQVDDSLVKVVHGESVLSVALSPTDRSLLLTGGQDDVAVLWTIHEKDGGLRCTERCRLQGHTDSVVEVAFSTDGVYAATASYDGTVRIWNAADGSLVQSLDGPSKEVEWILWHPKGHAILGGSNDTMAWMWWAPTGKVMQIFAGHGAGVSCGCWGLGGKVVVTGSEDHGVIVWNPRAGTPQHHLREVHESSIISICSHPESPIVVTGAEDATAKVVQIETGKVLAPLPGHIDSVEAVAFSNAKGTLLLATGSMDGTVQIWDAKSMDLRCTVKEHFEKGGVVKLKWLPGSTFGNWRGGPEAPLRQESVAAHVRTLITLWRAESASADYVASQSQLNARVMVMEQQLKGLQKSSVLSQEQKSLLVRATRAEKGEEALKEELGRVYANLQGKDYVPPETTDTAPVLEPAEEEEPRPDEPAPMDYNSCSREEHETLCRIIKEDKDGVAKKNRVCAKSALSFTLSIKKADFAKCMVKDVTGLSEHCAMCFADAAEFGIRNCKSSCYSPGGSCEKCMLPHAPAHKLCMGFLLPGYGIPFDCPLWQ